MARYPEIALSGSSAFLSEFVIAEPTGSSSDQAPGRQTRVEIRRPDGMWIGGPPGVPVAAYPQIAMRPDGTLHMVWAEPQAGLPDTATAEPLFWPFITVWHATLQGDRWSTPQPIYRAADVDWNPVGRSRLQVDDAGNLHLAFPAVDSATGPGIVHLRMQGSRWSQNVIRSRFVPGYVDLSVGSRGRLTITFVSAHHDSLGSHTNTLFVTRSADDGRTWTGPHPLTQPEQGPAYEPRLARGRGDTLHLVWMQSDAANPNATIALWHAVSSDGGASWGKPASYPISGMTHQLQAVAAPCGGLHVMYSDFTRQTLVYTRLAGETDPVMQTPFPGMAGNPVLRMDGNGTLNLIWTATTVTSPDASVWHTRLLHSTLRAC